MLSPLIPMLTLLANPVLLDIPSAEDGAERFVEGRGCSVAVEGDQVKGPAGCTVVIAIVASDGKINRTTKVLEAKQEAVATNPEDDPRLSEDEPDTVSDLPAEAQSQPTPNKAQKKDVVQTSKPATRVKKRPISRGYRFPLRVGPELVVQKDWSDFRYSIFGIAAVAVLFDTVAIDLRWERGETRSQTSLIDVSQAVEQTLDLFLMGGRYQYAMTKQGYAYVGFHLGTGRIKSDAILGERAQLSAAQQSLFALRPSAGLKYVAGSAALGIGWTFTWATGEWFDVDEFGSENGNGPPERSGVLSHGIEITVGFQL